MKVLNFEKFINENRVNREERIEILRDDKYIVVAPLTEKASCKYGAFTNWCTSALGSGAFSSVEDEINRDGKDKLVYIIQVNYKYPENNEEQSERYYYLKKRFENDDFDDMSEEEIEELKDKFLDMQDDVNSLNFSKIAIEYLYEQGEYNLWSSNNINISDYPWLYDIYDLPIDEYVIDKIKEFCENK